MDTLVLFDSRLCREFSDIDAIRKFYDLPKEFAINRNELIPLKENLNVLLSESHTKYLSTIGISPIRIGCSLGDHIRLNNTSAALYIYDGYVDIVSDEGVYLNGKKIICGKHDIVYGDSLWVGIINIIVQKGYISCRGTDYKTILNISTKNPEIYSEFPIYKRSPRIIKREPKETVDLSPPKNKEEHKKGELVKIIIPPLTMLAVTISMGFMMGRGLFVLGSAAVTLVTLILSISNFVSEMKSRREKEQERSDNYDNYLLTRRKKIYELHMAQQESLLYHNLSPKEIEQEILSYSSRLYERAASDGDFLTLSLGYSAMQTSYELKYSDEPGESTKDPLVEEMKTLGRSYQSLQNMPTVIDLKRAHLGLVGEKAYIHRKLSAIITQLCFFQSYHDIEIVMLIEQEDWGKFEWVRWYPHCRNKNINISGLVASENQRDQLLGNIAQVLKMRKQKQDEEKKDDRYLPHYIFIVDNPKLIINHSIMEYLQTPETSLGFSLIYTTHMQANLPEQILSVFLLDGGDKGTLLMNEGQLLGNSVTLYDMSSIDLETMARRLSPIRHSQGVSTQIPDSVTFFELYGVKSPEELPIAQLWVKNACHKSLAVPLGFRGKDDIVFLNLHEKAHGSHGLVAGTTGSGKSEIVQSYILSLAVNFHPHEVGFLLIDYKGGGMANLFKDLPHLLGTITNLDGGESMRALASIKSELARRQRIFNECNVNNINQYTKLFKAGEASLPMPHLFIISDEFAELKKEQPDFMSELVSTARIGRSLGVHLILATQKPSGVVDDQIWSNSKFKLALKVADESDSNEILKTPDAARITQPGRAYLQVGNNEIYEMFQSAWSGAPFNVDTVKQGFDSRIYLLNSLGQGELLNEDLSQIDEWEESKITQLDAVVSHIKRLHESMGSVIVERPWLPPLPQKLIASQLTTNLEQNPDVGKIFTHNLSVALAMADIPEEQTQAEYTHSFSEDGNFAIFGSSGFGKSTVMMNIGLTLASQNSPELLNYFVLDYGNSALAALRNLPHTADYLVYDDEEKLDKLIKLLTEEQKSRKTAFAAISATNFRMYNEISTTKLPAILLFIDNYDVIREMGGELEEFLVKLSRDGMGVGIYIVITASRSNAVRYSVLNNFKNKLALFMFDESDITAIAGRSSYKLPELRGRAMVKMKDVHIAQCYLPAPYENDIEYAKEILKIISEINKNNTAKKASGVRVVPDIVAYNDLQSLLNTGEKQIVLGFDVETTEGAYLDLYNPCHLIVGTPSTGKTNILKLALRQLEGLEDVYIFIADSHTEDLFEMKDMPNAVYMSNESAFDNFYQALKNETERRDEAYQSSGLRLKEFCAKQPLAVVFVDDGDNFIELCRTNIKDMEDLVQKAMGLSISFVVTTHPSKLRGYDNLSKMFKDTQHGLVLGNPVDQNIFQVSSPRGYKAAPNMGFLYKRSEITQVKLPFMG